LEKQILSAATSSLEAAGTETSEARMHAAVTQLTVRCLARR
jgi:hypothetical protein